MRVCVLIPLPSAAPAALLPLSHRRRYKGEVPGLPSPLEEPEHCFNTYYRKVRPSTSSTPAPSQLATATCRLERCQPPPAVLSDCCAG